jgi:biopolymer transport protein ExbD
MDAHSFTFGLSDEEGFLPPRGEYEPPEFDITAMVDLVFMMNLYFLVVFATVTVGQLNLPMAKHVAPLDAESAVIFTLTRTLDGKSVNVYIGESDKGEPIVEAAQQEKLIQDAVEQGKGAGKTEVLLKAEKKVRLADLFRIATAATTEGMKLHVGVLEREKR